MATGRRSGSIVVLEHDSATPAREASSGMATGRQVSGDPHEYVNSRNSAHATESLDAGSKDAAKMSKAQSNPMYKDNGMEGTNPLYQGKDKTAAPSERRQWIETCCGIQGRRGWHEPYPPRKPQTGEVTFRFRRQPGPNLGPVSSVILHFRGSAPRPGCIYSNFSQAMYWLRRSRTTHTKPASWTLFHMELVVHESAHRLLFCSCSCLGSLPCRRSTLACHTASRSCADDTGANAEDAAHWACALTGLHSSREATGHYEDARQGSQRT